MAATRAERACGCVRGTRGGRRGGSRCARGRGAAVAEGSGAYADDLDSKPSEVTELSESDLDSNSNSEEDIPIPRLCQQHQIWVIHGCCEEVAVPEANEEVVAEDNENKSSTEQPQPHPCPCPHMCKHPLEAQDTREIEEPHDGNAFEGENEPGMLQDRGEEHGIGPEIGIDLVPRVTDSSLETQDGRTEEPSRMQSGEIETQAGQQRC